MKTFEDFVYEKAETVGQILESDFFLAQSILESEYEDGMISTVGSFFKKVWNANTRSSVFIIDEEDVKQQYLVDSVGDDEQALLHCVPADEDPHFEGMHIGEIIRALKFYGKDDPIYVTTPLSDSYAIQEVNVEDRNINIFVTKAV